MINKVVKRILKFTRGKKLYLDLMKEHKFIAVFNNHIGEVVFTSAYMEAFKKKHGINHLTAVTKKSLSGILPLYKHVYDDVVVLDNDSIGNLAFYLNDKDHIKYHAINSIWDNRSTRTKFDRILSSQEIEPCYKMGAFYTEYMGLDLSSPVDHPVPLNKSNYEKEYDFTAGKAVLLIPEARSCKMLPSEFWNELSDRIADKGYKVFVNAGGDKTKVKGTRVFLNLCEMPSFVNACGKAISIQCGLSDLLVEAGCDCDVLIAEKTFSCSRRSDNPSVPFSVKQMHFNEDSNWKVYMDEILKHM